MLDSTIPYRIQQIYDSCTTEEKTILRTILEEIADTGDSQTYRDVWLADYKEIPVDKHTFLTDPHYLGGTNDCGNSIYPAWMDTMLELERTGNQYYEIVFTGATRTGKTSTAVSDCSYNLYRLMCLKNPQTYFGLKAVTRISVFFFNLTATLARGVAFKEFNTTLANSPWFMEHGHMSKSEATPTYIPEGGLIEIAYGSDASHALGKAVALVVFDECNFAAAGIKDIAKSKERMKAKYDTLVARVTGTFVKNGEVFGKLYIISSKNSDSDFMEEYIQKQKQANNQHMYIFDKSQWEVWPASKYSSDKKFYIALGGKKLRSYVVPDNITPDGLKDIELQGYRLLQVPEDNKPRFLADFDIALRDIAGISVPGTLSYITQEIIDKCIGTRQNPFFTDIVAIGTQSHDEIYDYFHTEVINYPKTSCPLFIHIDLSLNTDRTGISGVAITGHRDVNVGDKTESIPTFSHIFSVALQAPNGDKIPYMKVLAFLLWLRDNQHFWVKMITRDQFQSEYLAQELEKHGFGAVPKLSLDRTPDGYTAFRSVLTEERIDLLHCELLEDELIHLQRDTTTLIPDHPAGGCFTIDTKISLVDGRILTIGELLLEQEYKTNWVYTVNERTLQIEPKPIKKVFFTKVADELAEITFDNGQVVHCTVDHRFMLQSGNYIEARYLKSHHELMQSHNNVNIEYVNIITTSDCLVYDLEIEDNHNFALAAGVFVHNSKDVADSVAGATWAAIQNSEVVTLPATSVASVIANVNGSRRNVMNSNGTVLPSALQALQNIKKRGI